MYNLFVSGADDAWEHGHYEMERNRFLEYTNETVAAGFRELKFSQIDLLKRYPCLFLYEQHAGPARLGKLADIVLRGRKISLRFEFTHRFAELSAEILKPLEESLDIRPWEMNRTHWAVKDVPLLQALRPLLVHPAGLQDESRDSVPQATHDHTASSVEEFIRTVLAPPPGGVNRFYRGHARSTWRLEPGIFRKDDDGNFIYQDEDRQYRELLVSNSEDFRSDSSTLDRLVRMQHFSLPTRLLDISSNPLIALYFACSDDRFMAEDGEVIRLSIRSAAIKYFDSDTVSCLANLARLSATEKDAIEFSDDEIVKFNEQASIHKLLHYVKQEKPYFEDRIVPADLQSTLCIKGKRSNSRIAFQTGAFLLFGHDADIEVESSPDIQVERILITDKPRILKDLDQLNINVSTVFPSIESSARYIAGNHLAPARAPKRQDPADEDL